MITLIELPLSDLSVAFSRDMGENSIKVYKMPFSRFPYAIASSELAKEKITEFIKKEEGDVEIEFKKVGVKNTNSFNYTDVSEIVLSDCKKVKKALLKKKAYRLIERAATPFWLKLTHSLVGIFSKNLAYKLDRRYTDGCYNLVRYISISFFDIDAEKAMKAFKEDLMFLENKGLILGHLAMPSLMELTNQYGIKESQYCLFCFPLINTKKLEKLLNNKYPKYDELLLNILGTKYEALKGLVAPFENKTIEDMYKIEEVIIPEEVSSREEMIKNYNEVLSKRGRQDEKSK